MSWHLVVVVREVRAGVARTKWLGGGNGGAGGG